VAWVIHNGTLSIYTNGALSGSTTGSSYTYNKQTFTIGADAGSWSMTNYKFLGSVFQPMVTASAKYTSNFTPAADLSAGASNALFFLNPGANGSLADTVSGQTMGVGGTIVTLGSR